MGLYYEGLVYTWSIYAILFTPGPMAYATIMVYKKWIGWSEQCEIEFGLAHMKNIQCYFKRLVKNMIKNNNDLSMEWSLINI